MFCEKCGNQINPGENFCGKCGERVVNNQANPTPLPNDTSNSVNPTVMPSANDNVNPTLVGTPNVSTVNQESTAVSNSTTLEQKPKNNNVILFVIIGVLCALIAYFGVNLLFKKINSSGNNKPSTTKIVDKNHYDDNSSTTTTTTTTTTMPVTTKNSNSGNVNLSDLFCNAFKINDTVIKLPASYDSFKALGFELPSDKINNVINPNSATTMTLTDKNSNRLTVIFANTTSEIVKMVDSKITYITIKSSTSVKYTLPGNLTFDATADQVRNTFKNYKPIYDKAVVKGSDSIQYRSDDGNRYRVDFNFYNNKLNEVTIVYLF